MAQPAHRTRVALALSGGGSLGLAHIGVLKVLEEEGILAETEAVAMEPGGDDPQIFTEDPMYIFQTERFSHSNIERCTTQMLEIFLIVFMPIVHQGQHGRTTA